MYDPDSGVCDPITWTDSFYGIFSALMDSDVGAMR